MKYLQKSLSLFLCIVLCLSFFPFPAAYAEENIEEVESVSETEELEQMLIQDEAAFEEDQEVQPHEHSYTAVVTEPTCTEQGFTTYTCDCGDSYVDDYTDALNHPEIIDVPEVPATETESGTTAGKKCAVCGEILEGCEEIPALEETNIIVENQAENDSPIIEEEDNSASETILEEEALHGASYPSVFFFSDANFENLIVQDSVAIGSVYPIRMKWFAEYNNEGYDLTVYDSNKNAVAYASDTWTNTSYERHIIVTWDTNDFEPGNYTVEVVKKFYSLYRWNEAPTTSILYLQLEEVKPIGLVEEFVKRAYSLILGREADQAGLDFWVKGLKDKSLKGGDIVSQFMNSNEYVLANHPNADAVTAVYETMLDREPDAGGQAYWVGLLDKGCSYNMIINGFCGSPEFKGICDNYGIQAGTVATERRDVNPDLTAFVSRNYKCALNREGEADGLNYWAGLLLDKVYTPYQVAHGFVFSEECVNRGLNNSEFVTMLYRLYMDREPESGGLSYWVGQLDGKTMTREQVEAGFANSPEFKNIVKSYGLAAEEDPPPSSTRVLSKGTWEPGATNAANSKVSPEEWSSSGLLRATLAAVLYKDLPANVKSTQFKNALNNGDVFILKKYSQSGDVEYYIYYYAPEQYLLILYIPDLETASYAVVEHYGNLSYYTLQQNTDWKISKSDVDTVYTKAPSLR